MNLAKDLSKQAPRSPRERLGGYAIAARMIDKGRAQFNGTVGEYHFNCPVDKILLEFKGLTAADLEPQLKAEASDESIINWLNGHGTPRSAAEIKEWSDKIEATLPIQNPDHSEWFAGECARLGLDPQKTTLFDYLEADDRDTFKK
jgi:hypothetical protein